MFTAHKKLFVKIVKVRMLNGTVQTNLSDFFTLSPKDDVTKVKVILLRNEMCSEN